MTCPLSVRSSRLPPGSLLLHGLQPPPPDEASAPGPDAEAVPPTPDVDLLLECTFSYMHATGDDAQEEQPMEEQEDEFLSPLIGPEEEEEVEVCVTPVTSPLPH